MTDIDRLEQRLSAVERVLVDGDVALDELSTVASLADAVSELETRLDEHERRLADLEGSVQSIEGYVGNVESITDDVERQSAAAVATVDRLERRVEALEVELDDLDGGLLGIDLEDDDGADGSTPGAEEDVAADADLADDTVFEFGGDRGESTEPEPERSARDVLGGESRSPVDDGRPTDGTTESGGTSAEPSESEADAADGGGLFGSLLSRLP